MSTINNGIPNVPENTIDPAAGLNLALNTIDALLQVLVVSVGLNTPPGSSANGARFIVGTEPTGPWAGQANKMARWLDGAWQFFEARYALNAADGLFYVRAASTWASAPLPANVQALAGLTGAADRVPYFTGEGAMALAVLTAQARTFLAAVDAAGQRDTLNCANKSGDNYTGQHNYGNTGSLRFTGTSSAGAIAAAASSGGLKLSVVGSEPSPLFIDFDATVPDAASTLSVRFFRGLNTSGACSFVFHKGNGTVDTQHTLDGKGAVRLNRIDGETVIGSGTSNNVDRLQVAGSIIATGAIKLASFTLSTLPSAAANARGQIYCSNLAGQAAPVYSDGTNWRRVSDNTIAN